MRVFHLATFFLLVIMVHLFFGCASQAPSVQGTESRFEEHQNEAKSTPSVHGKKSQQKATDLSNLSKQDKKILELHNSYRSKHCAEQLKWSKRLARVAQAWANRLRKAGCAFNHSTNRKYGENLFFAGPSSNVSGTQAVETWYEENRSYSFKSAGFAPSTGHFTQVVWRGTRELGCGKAQCNGGDIWVCNYSPPGNTGGQYRENVLPQNCQ
jgi:uncharacterized protein YkwD